MAPETRKPEVPPSDLIKAQVERICADDAFKDRTRAADLFRYLVEIEQEGRYRGPFTRNRPKPTGISIVNEFYNYRLRDFQEQPPAVPPIAGKKLVAALRAILKTYYGANPNPKLKGRIKIEIPLGRGTAYRPKFSWIQKSNAAAPPLGANEPSHDSLTIDDLKLSKQRASVVSANPFQSDSPLSEQSYGRFFELLRQVKRGLESDTEDIRILTTSFSSGLPDIQPILEELLANNVRIKILIMDFEKKEILEARNRLRSRKGGDKQTLDKAVANCFEQFSALEELEAYPTTKEGCTGELQVLKYDTMPPGFYAQTSTWALLGLYWAKRSYSGGPFVEAGKDAGLWKSLKDDWDARWDDALKKAT